MDGFETLVQGALDEIVLVGDPFIFCGRRVAERIGEHEGDAGAAMSRACASGNNVNPDSVAFVNRLGTPITGNKSRTAARGRCGDKCVIRGTAGHAVSRQPKNEVPVGARTESQEGLAKSCA